MRLHRFLLGLILGSLLLLPGAAATSQVSLPEFGTVGEALPVQISGTEPLDLASLPSIPGAHWQNSRRQMVRSINGETTYTTVFFLVPEKAGKLTIPAHAFAADGQKFPAEEIAVEVTRSAGNRRQPPPPRNASADDGSIPVSQAVFGRISLPDRTDFYVGEEFRMDYQLFIRDGVRVHNVEYPVPSGVNDLIFANLSVLPENRTRRARDPRFYTFNREEVMKGNLFQVVGFRAFCRGVRPGTIRPGGKLSLQIVQRDHADDDLFGGFGGFSIFGSQRLEPYTAEFTCADPITIHPLPEAPAGAVFSGLVGNWALTAKLSPSAAAVGEPVELILSAEGDGSGEPFRIPNLSFPGFRAYPPKETREFGKITVKYVLVPLKPGKASLKFAVSVFDPKAKKFRVSDFRLTLPVRPGAVTPGAAAAAPSAPQENAESTAAAGKQAQRTAREELFYLKADRGTPVLTPLLENHGWLFPGLLVSGPVFGIILYGWLSFRKCRAADPSAERKARCRKMLPELRKALRGKAEPGPEVRRKILDALADALSLPPGAGASEIGAAASDQTKDPEIRRAVEELESASFLPGGSALSEFARKKLSALLKKVCLWTLVLFTLSGGAAENYNQLYEAGKFPEAAEHYRRDVSSGSVSPNALYNLGGTYARMGDLPRARLCYRQAHLLKPADGEITSNLEWVNRKLLQPPLYGEPGPAALLRECRDLLRPDQYLLIAAAAFFLLCLTLGLTPVLSRKTLLRTAGGLLLLLLLTGGCAWLQCRSSYSPDDAVVTAEALKLYSLPGAGGREESAIPGGSSARILDRRGDWVRVSANGQEGWAERSGLGTVFPWGIFSPEQEP